MKRKALLLGILGILIFPSLAHASGGGAKEENMMLVMAGVLFLLMAGRIGALVDKLKWPAVLGELIIGMLLGLLVVVDFAGIGDGIKFLKTDKTVFFIAEFGVILLLFKSGLEENLKEMMRAGGRAMLVAMVGVVLPMAGGVLLSYLFMSDKPTMMHIFMGATFTATSVGITA